MVVIKAAVAVSLVVAGMTGAQAMDLRELRDLLPCKAAAVRMCDRSQGLTQAALWRCGATLASRSNEVGQKCVAVLQRYGQLSVTASADQKAQAD